MRRLSARQRQSDKVSKTLVGSLIREQRRAMGMTQEQLAEIIGSSQDYISAIELGEYRPKPENLPALASALELPLAKLAEAMEMQDTRALTELEKSWAVGDPAEDIAALLPYLTRADQMTLVRLARVMAIGRRLKE